MEQVVKRLKEKQKTISTMESCTGGALANSITNIEGASEAFKFGCVTYSNEFKVKMGVDNKIIDRYTVYSIQTAREMSKKISDFTNSDYSVAITGKLNSSDPNNLYGDNNTVYFSIYDKNKNCFYDFHVTVNKNDRKVNKREVLTRIKEELLNII